MFIFFAFLIIFLVTQGFLVLDEEMLIILASVLWVDAAGGMIRKAIDSELVSKGDIIKDKFMWFLGAKHKILKDLIQLHETRKGLASSLEALFASSVSLIVNKSFSNFYKYLELIDTNSKSSLITDMVGGLSQVYYYNNLETTLLLIEDSGSDIQFFGKEVSYNNVFGSTKQLVVRV